MDEIFCWSAKRLAEAVRAKELSSLEVVEAHLRRIEEVNPKLNAVVQLRADQARAEARQLDVELAHGEVKGPLHGVPMTVKDSLSTEGVVTTAGTLKRKRFIPKQDATAVARMRAAGAILLGKTNCTELCGSGETDNQVYGRTNNPYDLARSTGGSSGGEVAIIAAGGSPLGLGSDFGGSIRGPAHLCGIAGLNPTMGRVPRTGHIPAYGSAFDTARIGPMARFVEDLALALKIISGPDGLDPSVIPVALGDYKAVDLCSLRVAFHTDNDIFPATPETVEVVRHVAQVLSDVGIAVVEECPPGLAETMEIADALWRANREAERCGMFREFREDKPVYPEDLRRYASLWLRGVLEVQPDDFMTASEFLAWTWKWGLCRSEMLSFLQKYDVILCPVDPYPALPHGITMQDDFPPQGVTAYTKPYSMAGWPSVAVRAGTSPEGLPIGVQIVAGPWREDVALAVAQHIESAFGGWQLPPI